MVKKFFKEVIVYKSTENKKKDIYKQILETAIDLGEVCNSEIVVISPYSRDEKNLKLIGYGDGLKIAEESPDIEKIYKELKNVESIEKIYVHDVYDFDLGCRSHLGERFFIIGEQDWSVYQKPWKESVFEKRFFKPKRMFIDVGLCAREVNVKLIEELGELKEKGYEVEVFKFY